MRKLFKMALIVFVPIIVGAVLLAVGSNTDDESLIKAGIMTFSLGLPLTMVVIVGIGIVGIIIGRIDLSDYRRGTPADKDAKNMPEDVREHSDIAEVNSAHGYKSQYLQNEYVARHAADNYKNSTTKERIFGWLFFGFLITDFALIIVFAALGIYVGAIVCFCLFGGTIITALIVVKISERLSLRAESRVRKNSKSLKRAELLRGKVKACLLSSSSSVGGASSHSTTRITSVTYRVKIDSNGKEYTAYTQDYYRSGDTVYFQAIGWRRAAIVDKNALKQNRKTGE